MIKCCKDCKERRPACHDTCQSYRAEKAEIERMKEAGRRERAVDDEYREFRKGAWRRRWRD